MRYEMNEKHAATMAGGHALGNLIPFKAIPMHFSSKS